MLKSSSTLEKTQVKSLAIGSFDGMHLAHQKLFKELCEAGAILFIEHNRANLTPKEYRCKFVKHPCFSYRLEDIKSLSGDEFLQKLIEDFPNLEMLVVGYDFGFGKNRSYNIDNLKELFPKKVKVVDEVKVNGISVHSSTIREIIKHGDIEFANRLLDRYYSIVGEKIKGQGIGKEKLVPTINIESNQFLTPESGIYATYTILDKEPLESVTFIGNRVSTDDSFAIETHILDRDIEIEIDRVEIQFLKKIRSNRKFHNLDKLKIQILKDIEIARALFSN